MTDAATTFSPDSPWDDPRWFREVASNATAMLLRLYGAHQLAIVEDAVQDAFVAAGRTWPLTGMPSNPTGWLVHTARNLAAAAEFIALEAVPIRGRATQMIALGKNRTDGNSRRPAHDGSQ